MDKHSLKLPIHQVPSQKSESTSTNNSLINKVVNLKISYAVIEMNRKEKDSPSK